MELKYRRGYVGRSRIVWDASWRLTAVLKGLWIKKAVLADRFVIEKMTLFEGFVNFLEQSLFYLA